MNDTTPQLSPAEYRMIKAESEAAPELEPGVEVGGVVELSETVEPDTEPPTTISAGVNDPDVEEKDIEIFAPELSPPEVKISEKEEEEIVAPVELPPST